MGKSPERVTTEMVSMSLPIGLKDTFKEECRKNGVTMSGILAGLMQAYIDASKKGVASVVPKEVSVQKAEKSVASKQRIRIGFQVDESAVEKAKAVAQEKRISLSQVYREIIGNWLDGKSNIKGRYSYAKGVKKVNQVISIEQGLTDRLNLEKKRSSFNLSNLMSDLLWEWLYKQGVEK